MVEAQFDRAGMLNLCCLIAAPLPTADPSRVATRARAVKRDRDIDPIPDGRGGGA
jgi:hypothetical protein